MVSQSLGVPRSAIYWIQKTKAWNPYKVLCPNLSALVVTGSTSSYFQSLVVTSECSITNSTTIVILLLVLLLVLLLLSKTRAAGCMMLARLKMEARELEWLNLHGCRALDTIETVSPRLSWINMYGCLAVGDVRDFSVVFCGVSMVVRTWQWHPRSLFFSFFVLRDKRLPRIMWRT